MPTHFITIVAHTSVFGFLYSRAIVERCLTACHCLILLVLATAIFITPETVEGCAKDPSPVFSVVSDSYTPGPNKSTQTRLQFDIYLSYAHTESN